MSTAMSKENKLLKWLRKLGLWGFIFFLVKGLAWLAIGYFVVK